MVVNPTNNGCICQTGYI
jgi:hypothetical protein